jgi:hypothetical protein
MAHGTGHEPETIDPAVVDGPDTIEFEPTFGAPGSATASAELRECLTNTMYSIELDPAALPGDLAWHLTLIGGQATSIATPG